MTLYNAEINKDTLEKDRVYLESFIQTLLANTKEEIEKEVVKVAESSTESNITQKTQELIRSATDKVNTSIKESLQARHKHLCEQLYIFLTNYVNSRLIYENTATKEDFIQDTMMFLLKRFDSLTKEEQETINLEKFFYNRARSFIGERLRRRSGAKSKFKVIKDEVLYLEATNKTNKEVDFIDDIVLDSLISKYRLNAKKSKILKALTINKLILLGYFGESTKFYNEDSVDVLNTLSYSVADEYILTSAQEGVNNYK